MNQYQRLSLDDLERIEIGESCWSYSFVVPTYGRVTQLPLIVVFPSCSASPLSCPHCRPLPAVAMLKCLFSGPEPTFFGKPKFSCMRLHYTHNGTSGYFHTLRAVARSPEEDGKGKEFYI